MAVVYATIVKLAVAPLENSRLTTYRHKSISPVAYETIKCIDLLIANIIGTLVDTFTKGPTSQSVRHIFNIRHTINDSTSRPSQIAA